MMTATSSVCSDFLRVLHEPGAWFEIRAIKAKETPGKTYTKTASGYFDSPVEAGEAAELLDSRHSPAGTYVTINPVNQACAARAYRQVKFGSSDATEGGDILRRRWIVLDIDSERPKGVSATKAEAMAATAFAQRIETELHAEGWPLPVRCMTGNGAMLLYRVDLPNDKASEQLVRDVLKALSLLFADGGAHIDTGLYDANRIIKVMGTHGRKGDSTPDRPHRKSAFKAPAEISVVRHDLLLAVADKVRGQQAAATTKSGLIVKDTGGQEFERIESTGTSVRGYLERHGVTVKREREKGGTIILDLEACPITGANGGSSVSVLIEPGGKISYPNRHNRGVGLTWFDLRDHFEPGYKRWQESLGEATATAPQSPVIVSQHPVQGKAGALVTISAEELCGLDIPPVRWIIPGIVPEGLTVLVGNPKVGKSTFLLSAVLELAAGVPVFGRIESDEVKTLYLALEDNRRRIQERIRQMNGFRRPPQGLVFVTADTASVGRLGSGGEKAIEEYLDANPHVRLVVIDTWVKIKPWKNAKTSSTEYDADSAAWSILHEISTRRRVAIVVVHHTRKPLVQGGDWTLEISGSQGIAGIVDTILLFKRGRGEHHATLNIAGREHDEEKELRFRGDKDTKTWSLSTESDSAVNEAVNGAVNDEKRHSVVMRDIVDALRFDGRPLWPFKLAETLGLESSDTLRRPLILLWQRGSIEKNEKGQYYLTNDDGTFTNRVHGVHGVHDIHGTFTKNENHDSSKTQNCREGVSLVHGVHGTASDEVINTHTQTEREKERKEGLMDEAPKSPASENPPPGPPQSTPSSSSLSLHGAIRREDIPPPPQLVPVHLHGGWTATLGSYNQTADNLRRESISLLRDQRDDADWQMRARKYVAAVAQANAARAALVGASAP